MLVVPAGRLSLPNAQTPFFTAAIEERSGAEVSCRNVATAAWPAGRKELVWIG